MPAPIRFQVQGLKALDRKLKELEPAVARKVVRQGMRAGIKLVRDQARANFPVRSGTARKSIKVRAGKRKRGVISIRVSTGAGDFQGEEFYGSFVEFGTKKQKAQHPLERAAEARGQEACDRAVAEMKAGVLRAARQG